MNAALRRVPSDAVLVLAGWVLFGLFRGSSRLIASMAWGRDVDAARVFLAPLVSALAWAALTPLVALLCRRLPAGETRLGVLVGAHLLYAIPLVFLQGVLMYPAVAALEAATPTTRAVLEDAWFRFYLGAPRQLTHALGLAGILTLVQAVRRTRTGARKEARLAAELVEAELEGLRARLRPQFFFRAIDAILARVRERPGDAEEIVVSLGVLLRSAAEREAFSTLREERELLQAHARVETRITELVESVEPDTLDLEVPSGLLARLAEEAVERTGGGALDVRAWREGETLKLRLEADAPAAGLLVPGASPAEPPPSARLARLYGGASTLTVVDAPVFSLSLDLPARRARPATVTATAAGSVREPFGIRRSA